MSSFAWLIDWFINIIKPLRIFFFLREKKCQNYLFQVLSDICYISKEYLIVWRWNLLPPVTWGSQFYFKCFYTCYSMEDWIQRPACSFSPCWNYYLLKMVVICLFVFFLSEIWFLRPLELTEGTVCAGKCVTKIPTVGKQLLKCYFESYSKNHPKKLWYLCFWLPIKQWPSEVM